MILHRGKKLRYVLFGLRLDFSQHVGLNVGKAFRDSMKISGSADQEANAILRT